MQFKTRIKRFLVFLRNIYREIILKKYKYFLYFSLFFLSILAVYHINNTNHELMNHIQNQNIVIEKQSQNIEKLNIELLKISTVANNNAQAYNKLSELTNKKVKNIKVKQIEVKKDETSNENVELSRVNNDINLSLELHRVWNEYKDSIGN